MVSAKRLFLLLEVLTMHSLGLVMISLTGEDVCKFVHAAKRIRMVAAKRLFTPLEGLAMHRLSLVVLAPQIESCADVKHQVQLSLFIVRYITPKLED